MGPQGDTQIENTSQKQHNSIPQHKSSWQPLTTSHLDVYGIWVGPKPSLHICKYTCRMSASGGVPHLYPCICARSWHLDMFFWVCELFFTWGTWGREDGFTRSKELERLSYQSKWKRWQKCTYFHTNLTPPPWLLFEGYESPSCIYHPDKLQFFFFFFTFF